MFKQFSDYNYTPLLDLKKSDYISERENLQELIPFGEDNLLPTLLNKLAREVPIHRAILNSKSNYISGNGIVSENPLMKKFIEQPNNSNETFRQIVHKVIHDYLTNGNGYLELVTNKNKSFLYCFHADSSKVRINKNADGVIIHPNWEAYTGKGDKNSTHVPLFPLFSLSKIDGLYHSIYHIKDYEPEFYYYGLCSYFAGIRSIIIAGLTNIWNQSRLENQFSATGMLIVPGVNSDADAEALDQEFAKFKGADNERSSDIIIQYLKDLAPGETSQKAQFIQFAKNNEANWLSLHQQSELSLITIHNWYKSLTPYSGDSGGYNTDKIVNEYEIAISTLIKPMQFVFLQHLDNIFQFFNMPVNSIAFINQPPISRINPLSFVWEARRDAGMDYDKNDPTQKLLIMQLKNTFKSETIK